MYILNSVAVVKLSNSAPVKSTLKSVNPGRIVGTSAVSKSDANESTLERTANPRGSDAPPLAALKVNEVRSIVIRSSGVTVKLK